MSAASTEPRRPAAPLAESAIKAHCKQLHLPTIGGQCARLAAAKRGRALAQSRPRAQSFRPEAESGGTGAGLSAPVPSYR